MMSCQLANDEWFDHQLLYDEEPQSEFVKEWTPEEVERFSFRPRELQAELPL